MVIKAFIARSFADADSKKLQPLLSYLSTFDNVGFHCVDAEGAEVDSISEKVRRKIDDCDVLIGIFTRRHPIYAQSNRTRNFVSRLINSDQPTSWTTPPWVLQESGYALRGDRKLILLREEGVETFGLQGDLEYIPFSFDNLSNVFPKLNEMILSFVSLKNGEKFEFQEVPSESLRLESDEQSTVTEKPPAEEPLSSGSLFEHFMAIMKYLDDSNTTDARMEYEAGIKLIENGEIKDFDLLAWECFYQQKRFMTGAADALERLKRIAKEHTARHEPFRSMANCYMQFEEFGNAAKYFVSSASVAPTKEVGDLYIRASEAFLKDKNYQESEFCARNAINAKGDEISSEAIESLFQVLIAKSEFMEAFAVAEAALNKNPQMGYRFNLGLAYHRNSLNELGLYHFKTIYEMDSKNYSALHNYALLSSECGLTISANRRYRTAYESGITLSAANLAKKYLAAGMYDEANELIGKALKIEPHDIQVDKCFTEIINKDKNEIELEREKIESATKLRSKFGLIGIALNTVLTVDINGKWDFPFGTIQINCKDNSITGIAEIEKFKFGALAVLGGDQEKDIEVYEIKGSIKGSVLFCDVKMKPKARGLYPLFSGSESKAIVIFDVDGENASYIEIKDKQLEETKRVRRKNI